MEEVIEQNSGYVVKKDGVMYIADTNVLEEATVVLRIGKNFLDISNNGFEGDYQTIIALDGTINADFIKTGAINANLITTGTLDASKAEITNINAENINSGKIKTELIESGSITSEKISSNAITSDKIATDAIEAKHIKAGAITADDITSGTMKADRIRGGTLKLGGESNQSGELDIVNEKGNTIFKASKEGLVLPNGTEIIGKDGLLSNLQFGQYKWNKVGYSTDYAPTGVGEWLYIDIPLFIPENFIITHAYITIEHSPIAFIYYESYPEEKQELIWGYCRNLRAYKQDEKQDFFEEVQLRSEMFPENNLATIEIVNAFGSNGFNPMSANENNHIVEKITSIDIKDYLTSGKAETIQIRSGNEIPELNPDLDIYQTNYFQQTGNVKAIINVFGFIK